MKTFLSAAMVLSSLSVHANIAIGELQQGGKACLDVNNAVIEVIDSSLRIQSAAVLKKSSADLIARESCNLAIPVQIDPSKKLLIHTLRLRGLANLAAKSKIRITQEVFLSGQLGELNEIDLVTNVKKAKRVLRGDIPVQIETECGADAIVRENLGLLIQGSGGSSISLHSVELLGEVVDCQL